MSSALARSLASTWLGIAINLIVGFIVPAMIFRNLGADSYGIWTLLASLTGHLILLDFGTRHAIVRFTAQYRASNDLYRLARLLVSATSFLLLTATAGLAIMGVLAWWLPDLTRIPADLAPVAQILLILLALDAAIDLVTGVWSSALGGLERYDILHGLNSLRQVLNGVLAVGFIWSGLGIWAPVLALIISRSAYRLVIYRVTLRQLPQLPRVQYRWDREILSEVFRFGFLTALFLFASRVSYQLDLAVIGFSLDPAAVAAFAVPLLLIDQVRAISDGSSLVLFSRLATSSEDLTTRSLLYRWMRYGPLLPMIVGTHLIVFGPDFIGLWIGTSLPNSGIILALLVTALFFSIPASGLTSALLARGRPGVAAKYQILEALLNLTISIVFIRHLGLPGVAIGTLIPAVIFQGWLLPRASCRMVSIPYASFVKESLLSVAAPTLLYLGVLLVLKQLIDIHGWGLFFIANALPLPVVLGYVWRSRLSEEDRGYISRQVRTLWRT
jgi:O-antigen/teichoic acid export membrane protein